MENKKKLIIVVVLVSLMFCIIGGCIIMNVVNNKEVDDKPEIDTENKEENNTDVVYENFDYEKVVDIVIRDDASETDIQLTSEEDIKYILNNLDQTEFVREWPMEDDFWSSNPTTIEICHKDNISSVFAVFLPNGNIVIDYEAAVSGSEEYVEYKLYNQNFKKELSEKYGIEIIDGFDKNEEEKETTYKYIEYEGVSKIVIGVTCKDCGDPDFDEVKVTDEKEIKYILDNLDKAEFVRNWPEETGIGGIGAMTLEVVYNNGKDPSVVVRFLGDERVAINYANNSSKGFWAEYKISNAKFKDELLAKYQK